MSSAGSAYGYLLDQPGLQPLLNPPAPGQPLLHVAFGAWPAPALPAGWRRVVQGQRWEVHVSPDGADVRTWTDPAYAGDARPHPGLAAAAVSRTLVEGGEALHGGCVAGPDGALALLADREGGKTTTLAHLSAVLGVPVLSDDQVVLRDGLVHAGPRSLDLRAPAVAALDLPAVPVRGGERHRHLLPAAPLVLPLVGLVVLAWGERVAVGPVPPSQRPALLGRHRTLPGQRGGRLQPLELSRLPVRRLTRPRGEQHLPAVARALLGG